MSSSHRIARKSSRSTAASRSGALGHRVRIGAFVLVAAVSCSQTSGWMPSRSEAPTPTSRMTAAPSYSAESASGVIWRLPDVSASSDDNAARSAELELRAELNWALLEYRSAFVGREAKKLESIWQMSAVERLLIKQAWSTCEEIDLTLNDLVMRVEGEEAVVDFKQELTFLCPGEARTSYSDLTASMKQEDGTWKITRIGNRESLDATFASPGPARLAADSGSAMAKQEFDIEVSRALEALADYETSLQNCDLDNLARVWIMTDLERQILQGLCFRGGKLDVTISKPQVSQNDGKVSIDFTHDFTKPGREGPMKTRSRLTALFVERDGGDLAIWKIRAAE